MINIKISQNCDDDGVGEEEDTSSIVVCNNGIQFYFYDDGSLCGIYAVMILICHLHLQ